MKGTYMLAVLLVAFGGFISLGKSQWTPVKELDFLGLLINSDELSVSVPLEKYNKCMQEIDHFHQNRPYDMKNLERIRGRLNSCKTVLRLVV